MFIRRARTKRTLLAKREEGGEEEEKWKKAAKCVCARTSKGIKHEMVKM